MSEYRPTWRIPHDRYGRETHEPKSEEAFFGESTGKERYFHGSGANLQPGDRLVPGAEIGRDNYHMDRDQHVYMEPQQEEQRNWRDPGAWIWAKTAALGDLSGPEGRSTVYTVKPEGYVTSDGLVEGALRSPGAVVENRIDIPPPPKGSQGRQGTLPPINWRQFHKHGYHAEWEEWDARWRWRDDIIDPINHPTVEQVSERDSETAFNEFWGKREDPSIEQERQRSWNKISRPLFNPDPYKVDRDA